MQNQQMASKAVVRTISAKAIDGAVRELFYSLTRDLGRPFKGDESRLRRVVGGWDPLKLGYSPLSPLDFQNSYMPAHFFDRYIFVREMGTDLENEAFEKFLATNFQGSMHNARLAQNKGEYLDDVLGEASLLCYRILGEFDYLEVFGQCNHGPGAAVGVLMRDASLASKCLTLTGTPAAHAAFVEYRLWNTTLDTYLRSFLPNKGGYDAMVVCGNKLSFVPKKFNSLRTMQIEPVVNEFLQLGTGSVIADRLFRHAGIDLTTQNVANAGLARWASKHGLLATIDWSDASGRIWVNLIRRLVPPAWFEWLMAVRSPVTTYAGKEIPLQMMGTMGNGFTFPLQTLVFYCLLRALARTHNLSEFVSVFGDDCIVDEALMPYVKEFAEQVGFKLNADKSFEFGAFRESCGMDAYRGVGCRPFMVERPNDTSPSGVKAWVYTCFNGIQARYGHVNLAWTLDWVKWAHDAFELGNFMVVPMRFPTTSGVQVATPERLFESTPAIYVDKHGGVSFKYHAFKPERMTVPQDPYYIWALMGKGVPQSFSKGVVPTFGDEFFQNPQPQPDGTVPAKVGVYKTSRRVYVHTWMYYDL